MSDDIKDFFKLLVKGGEGSGNFGHSGRPGEVGGSGDGGGSGGKSKKDRKKFRDAWQTSLENATGSNDHTPYGKMDEEETMAVRLYSTHASETLNNGLRNGSANEDVKLWGDFVESGLDKLPDSPGVVFRGVNVPRDFDGDVKDFVDENFKVGTTVSDKGFTSASGSFSVATDFIDKPNNGVVFSMKSKSGKEISEVSWAPTENETVFNRGTKFKVTRISQSNNKWAPYTVHMTEEGVKAADDKSELFMQLLEESEEAFRSSVSD